MNIKVLKNVLEANDTLAARIRDRLAAHHITTINLISAPGAGKTSLLERTLAVLRTQYRLAVLEGDIATTRDADRIAKLNVPVVQLLTGGACHLTTGSWNLNLVKFVSATPGGGTQLARTLTIDEPALRAQEVP